MEGVWKSAVKSTLGLITEEKESHNDWNGWLSIRDCGWNDLTVPSQKNKNLKFFSVE